MGLLEEWFLSLLPSKSENPESRFFKIILYLSLGSILLMVLAGIVTFLLTMEGAEQTMVPDTEELSLEEAMIELQEKELYAQIQLRYSTNPDEKGMVINQAPKPGTLVKAGTQVVLTVSKGAIIDRVEDYIGWKLSDLEIHLQTLFTTYGPLLKIKRPVMGVFDDSPAGTILEQKPLPGTELSGVTDLELVVSRGPRSQMIEAENYIDIPWNEAFKELKKNNIPFVFTARDAEGEENPGTVMNQSPEPGSEVPSSTLFQITITRPEGLIEDEVFGILEWTLPDYPVAVELTLKAINEQGDERTVLSMKHPGGVIAVPYVEPVNTILTLSIAGKEILRHTVRPKIEEE